MRVLAPRPSAPVAPLELISPGFRGLNTELTSVAGDVPGQWALALQEAVFDETGTISGRKGYQELADTAGETAIEVTVGNLFGVNRYYGYVSGGAGSTSPNPPTVDGYTITRIHYDTGGAPDSWAINVSGSPGDGFFTDVTFETDAGSITLLESDAVFADIGGGVHTWTWDDVVGTQIWDGGDVGLTYTMTFNQALMAGSPAILREFEYIQDDGTKILIAQTDDALWKSTDDGVTWVDITGSLTWTTTRRWQFANFNGVVIGVVKGEYPAVYTGSGNFTVITASSGVLPVSDGTVLAAFGRLWLGEDSTGAVVYGGLLSYILYATADGGGSLDTSNVWTSGMDERMAMKAFGATFVIFGRRHIIMYVDGSGSTLGIDPTNMYVVDTIEGTGCVARDSVVNIGEGDLWYLSPTGVQSIARVLQDKANPLTEVTRWCSSLLKQLAANEPNLRWDVQATYNATERFVLFLFPSSDRIVMLDTRYLQQDGTARVAEWRDQTHNCLLTRVDGTMHFGRAGTVAEYTGYYDGTVGNYITLLYASPWLNFKARGMLKMPKRVTWSILGRETLSLITRWGFDFRGLEHSMTQTNDYIESGSEYGLAEFGEDEWTSGVRTRRGYTPLSGNGGNMQIYFALTNADVADRVSIKDLIIYTRIGRAI